MHAIRPHSLLAGGRPRRWAWATLATAAVGLGPIGCGEPAPVIPPGTEAPPPSVSASPAAGGAPAKATKSGKQLINIKDRGTVESK